MIEMIIKVLLILKTRGEVIFFLQCENFCIRDLKIFLEDLFDEKNWHTLDNFFFLIIVYFDVIAY